MKTPISVCIPTYNGSSFLAECIDSILSQTFSDFELIIVDDRSSDRTLEIAQEYAARDSRITVIENFQNLGLVGNWNRCVELAKGEWIKFVFQDDTVAPTCLEKMFAATQLGKPIIYCRRSFIFEAGTQDYTKDYYLNHLSVRDPFSDTVEISAQEYAELAVKNIGINLIGEPTSVLLHRNTFSQFGSFNPHLIMICDFEFYTRIAIHTGIVQIPEVLAHFRVHGSASTAVSNANRQYRGWVLDPLILLHDFAFHVAYEPIRAVAQQCYPKIDIAHLFKDKAFLAWKIAQREKHFAETSVFSPHVELEKISKFYPLIPNIIEINAIKRLKENISLQIELAILYIKCNIKKVLPITQIKQKFARLS
jgi:glycosyltransferase involved in cell wall biosynthesis